MIGKQYFSNETPEGREQISKLSLYDKVMGMTDCIRPLRSTPSKILTIRRLIFESADAFIKELLKVHSGLKCKVDDEECTDNEVCFVKLIHSTELCEALKQKRGFWWNVLMLVYKVESALNSNNRYSVVKSISDSSKFSNQTNDPKELKNALIIYIERTYSLHNNLLSPPPAAVTDATSIPLDVEATAADVASASTMTTTDATTAYVLVENPKTKPIIRTVNSTPRYSSCSSSVKRTRQRRRKQMTKNNNFDFSNMYIKFMEATTVSTIEKFESSLTIHSERFYSFFKSYVDTVVVDENNESDAAYNNNKIVNLQFINSLTRDAPSYLFEHAVDYNSLNDNKSLTHAAATTWNLFQTLALFVLQQKRIHSEDCCYMNNWYKGFLITLKQMI